MITKKKTEMATVTVHTSMGPSLHRRTSATKLQGVLPTIDTTQEIVRGFPPDVHGVYINAFCSSTDGCSLCCSVTCFFHYCCIGENIKCVFLKWFWTALCHVSGLSPGRFNTYSSLSRRVHHVRKYQGSCFLRSCLSQ